MLRPFLLLAALLTCASSAEGGVSIHREHADVQLNTKILTFEGSDVIYHIHSPDSPTLLLFHGCVHRAEHFFPPSSGCPKCVGLPEDLAITRAAAAAGYNVVAFTSLDRKSGCWSRPDRQAVLASHKALAEQEKLLAAAPLYGLGASSGGAFLLRLANYLPFQAIVPMIANRTKPRPGSEQPPTLAPYPPTLFVHMTRDTTMTVRIAADVKDMLASGGYAAAVGVEPLPIGPKFFADRITDMSGADSDHLQKGLIFDELLDEAGFLTANPRGGQWTGILPQEEWDAMGGKQRLTQVSQSLNVAYAQHEMVADQMPTILKFFHDKHI